MNPSVIRAIGLLLFGACAAVWLSLEGVGWTARAVTVFLLVPLPAMLLLQARLVDQLPDQADREAVYLSSALSVWILAGLSMVAARFGGISRQELRLALPDLGTLATATALTLAAGLSLVVLARLLRLPESRLVDYLIPRSGSEKIAFVGLSVSAGIGEELVYRSFLIAALTAGGVPLTSAVAVSVAAFAVAHAYQGVLGVVRVALLGVVLTAPFLLTGSVYPSMIAHAMLDVITGLILADWLLEPSRD